jgi:HEAT repeat protein
MELNSICCKKEQALPLLERLMHESDLEVAVHAAGATTLIKGGLDAKTLETLRLGLQSDDAFTAWLAAWTLRNLGPKASQAVPDLIKALDHPGNGVRAEAVRALGSIGSPARAAVPKLEALAQGGDPVLGENARQALEVIRKK